MKLVLIACSSSFRVNSAAVNYTSRPVVVLDYAVITGVRNHDYNQYLGIPFAEPPVGKNRFKPPIGINRSINVDAKEFGYSCWQKGIGLHDIGSPVRDEDCLTLNVWSPNAIDKLFPVVVLVYGGGFDSGYSSHPYYNFSRLATRFKDVVFVSFNYRVGAFGFLAGNEIKESEGLNVGLLDQIMVFEWVQKYILEFGGDPKKVTAVGQSAGAISLSLLMSNNLDLRLFQKAVLMSGGPAMILKHPTQSQGDYEKISNLVNCTSFECLQNAEAQDLWAASKGIPFYPVIDGSLVQKQPLISYLDGDYSKIPLMLTGVREEGNLFALPLVKSFDHVFPVIKQLLPFFNFTALASVQYFYNISKYDKAYKVVGDLYGDFLFQCPSYFISKLALKGNITVYRSLFSVPGDSEMGVTHGSDLPYLFMYESAKYATIAEFVASQWLNFARSTPLDLVWKQAYDGILEISESQKEMILDERSKKCEFLIGTMMSLFQK